MLSGAHRIAHRSLRQRVLLPSRTAGIRFVQIWRVRLVREICRQKGGAQPIFLKNILYGAIMDLQEALLGERLRNSSGTQVGMLPLVLSHSFPILLADPTGMGMNSMGSILKSFNAPLSETVEITIDGAKRNLSFFMDLLGGFLVHQDRTYQFVLLESFHSVASMLKNSV